MIRVSTGYKAPIAELFADVFDDCVLRLYTGPMPASADAPVTGAYIAYVTKDGAVVNFGNGLRFLANTAGFASILPGDTIVLTGTGTGTIGYGRLSPVNDDGSASSVTPRMDFEVDGTDFNGIILPVRTVFPGLTKVLSGFFYTIPG